MEIETAAPIIINDRESPRTKKQKTGDDDGDWVVDDDDDVRRIIIEKLNEKYDNFGFIDDEKLRDEARAYHQRRIDNPFDIDDLPPPPIPDYFEEIWPVDPSSWRWETAKELMHFAVKTQQDKEEGWNLTDLNLVKANKLQYHYFITFEAKHDQEETSTYQTTVLYDVLPCGYGSIDVEFFRRKGQAPAAVIGHN